ncbi:Nitrosoguanidine resistance protein SNG1 [Spathaspora sp. JA1]|nr:Nitrosoguanidine resistance protein SNG1 [Spathaspora sp. JA1]
MSDLDARLHSIPSLGASIEESMQPYSGRHSQDTELGIPESDEFKDEDDNKHGEPLSRQQTILERIQSRYSFFNENLNSQRKKLYIKFGLVYLIMAVGVLSIFSIYWGSMYGRDGRIKNLRMLVIIEDDHEIEGIPPLFGDQIQQILQTDLAHEMGNWIIYNSSEFNAIAEKHNNSVEQELQRQIHHQNYWSSIYVKPNATWNFYNALLTGTPGYNVSNSSIISLYETGRDLINMVEYVVPSVQAIEREWLDTNTVAADLISRISNKTEVFSNANSVDIMTQSLNFEYYDMRPQTSPVLVAPSQVGLLYMIIVTFFQFNFFVEIHKQVAQIVKKSHYLLYRIVASTLSYFVISLMFSLVTLAMQVDFTVAFGKSGFLVYWMVSFLTMWAVGAANEIAAMLLITVYPPLLGFWLIFWVIINITPTFTPMALSAQFFRYGYGLPLHNSFEISKVVFFDTYKGQMGRNLGIIIAWVVILTAIMPFVIIYFGKTMAKKAQKAAAAAAQDKDVTSVSLDDASSSNSSTIQEKQNDITELPVVQPPSPPDYSFFHEKLAPQRKTMKFEFMKVYLSMAIGVLAIFSIYWGSMYGRTGRIQNLRMLVVIEDDTSINGIPPLFGNSIRQILDTPLAKSRGNWQIFNSTEFEKIALENNNNVEQELQRQIHHQNYWSSIYVKGNATWNFYNAIVTGDASYNVTNSSIISVYETGRDFLNMNSYVTPSIQAVERLWLGIQTNITEAIVQSISNTSEVLSQPGSLSVLATPINFAYFDRIKFSDPVLVAPSQVGLIYTVIITFFQFQFFAELHISAAKSGMKKQHYVLYRIAASLLSYFVLSLFFSLVSLAFQVDFSKAFGKSGFLVYWAITFLTMWAVGAANELMALLCILVYPPLVGFWLLFWVIINIAPTFTPLALSPDFFRFGYAMPIHNSYEAAKVVLFNTYKGTMGRNIGILIVWIVLLTAVYPFVLALFGKTMMKRAQQAAQAEAEKKKEEEASKSEVV